jgi:hypothetical protein
MWYTLSDLQEIIIHPSLGCRPVCSPFSIADVDFYTACTITFASARENYRPNERVLIPNRINHMVNMFTIIFGTPLYLFFCLMYLNCKYFRLRSM